MRPVIAIAILYEREWQHRPILSRWCRCFSPAGQGQTILSGGNDGKIVLQHWAKQTPATNSHGDLALASPDDQMCIGLLHGRKVNYLASELSSAAELYVADVSKHVTIYKCR